MTAWALFCHDFDLSKGINILSEKCPVVLDHYNLAESDGVVCGLVWCKLSDRETGLAEIFQMWVNPKHRGIGVGEKLLQAAIECARNHSMERIGLEVTATNSAAAAFYQSQGFQQVGEIELTNVASEDTHAFLLQL